jgi:hypothetical protein
MSDYDTLREEAVAALRIARARLAADIASYPAPISGCDTQFSHLLAERKRLSRALGALEAEVFVPSPRRPAPARGIESR